MKIAIGRAIVTAAGLVTFSLAANPSLADATADFEALLGEVWEWQLAQNPMSASQQGDRRFNTEWRDRSLDGIEQRQLDRREFLRRIYAIDKTALSESDQLNYELFRRSLQQTVDEHQFNGHLMPFNQRGGIQNLDSNTAYLRFETVDDYEDWLARLSKVDTVIEQTIEVADRGIAEEMVLPRVLMERIPDQICGAARRGRHGESLLRHIRDDAGNHTGKRAGAAAQDCRRGNRRDCRAGVPEALRATSRKPICRRRAKVTDYRVCRTAARGTRRWRVVTRRRK